MGESAKDEIVIGRPPTDVMAVILDLEAYPQWADGVSKVEVLSRDDQGRPVDARMFIDAKVFELDYVLRYVHESPTRITWTLTEGSQLTRLDGSYDLTPVEEGTHVTYSLEVDLQLPLPGFMRKRGAKVIMATGLKGLRAQVEGR